MSPCFAFYFLPQTNFWPPTRNQVISLLAEKDSFPKLFRRVGWVPLTLVRVEPALPSRGWLRRCEPPRLGTAPRAR